MTRLIAIDPALRNTGYAVVERLGSGAGLTCLEYGVIRNPATRLQSACLTQIHSEVADVVARLRPGECAIEAVIYVQSYRTAITLGAARGAALVAVAAAGLPVVEYPPRRVKQAVVGRGGADKQQVAFMVRSLLSLRETPPPDAADALAIAITHFQSNRPNHPRAADVRNL